MNAKRILLALAFLIAICLNTTKLNGQETTANSIGAKVLLVDFGIPNSLTDLRTTNGLEVFFRRDLSEKIGLSIPLKMGVAHFNNEINNKNFVALDATLLYKIGNNENNLRPYVLGGGGAFLEDNTDIIIQIPVGVGVSYRLTDNAYINAQGEYRLALEDFRNNVNVGVGVLYRLGKGAPDSDRDGVPDTEDVCPTLPGTKELKGCPDTDGDGITDNRDQCPNEIGTEAMNGCPDSDNDGVSDKDDQCPNEPGTVATQGCPDTDGDGIMDKDDKCPLEAGTRENDGCPVTDRDGDGVVDEDDSCPDEPGTPQTNGCPDTDGDGVPDRDDRCPDLAGEFGGCPDTDGDGIVDVDDVCPDQPGLLNNKGCPELNEEDRRLLRFAMRAVQFETGRSELKQESYSVLDQIKGIMDRYPGYKLTISGYTDSVGDNETNKILSEERAKSCYQYLVSLGVDPSKLAFQGFGEENPIASNRTSTGRRLNRRVQFDLTLE